MTVRVRLAEVLRPHAGGAGTVELDVPPSATIGELLDVLAACHPALGRRIRNEEGAVRTHVNVFVGADNIRDLDGQATAVPPGAEVSVLPAVSGG